MLAILSLSETIISPTLGDRSCFDFFQGLSLFSLYFTFQIRATKLIIIKPAWGWIEKKNIFSTTAQKHYK